MTEQQNSQTKPIDKENIGYKIRKWLVEKTIANPDFPDKLKLFDIAETNKTYDKMNFDAYKDEQHIRNATARKEKSDFDPTNIGFDDLGHGIKQMDRTINYEYGYRIPKNSEKPPHVSTYVKSVRKDSIDVSQYMQPEHFRAASKVLCALLWNYIIIDSDDPKEENYKSNFTNFVDAWLDKNFVKVKNVFWIFILFPETCLFTYPICNNSKIFHNNIKYNTAEEYYEGILYKYINDEYHDKDDSKAVVDKDWKTYKSDGSTYYLVVMKNYLRKVIVETRDKLKLVEGFTDSDYKNTFYKDLFNLTPSEIPKHCDEFINFASKCQQMYHFENYYKKYVRNVINPLVWKTMNGRMGKKYLKELSFIPVRFPLFDQEYEKLSAIEILSNSIFFEYGYFSPHGDNEPVQKYSTKTEILNKDEYRTRNSKYGGLCYKLLEDNNTRFSELDNFDVFNLIPYKTATVSTCKSYKEQIESGRILPVDNDLIQILNTNISQAKITKFNNPTFWLSFLCFRQQNIFDTTEKFDITTRKGMCMIGAYFMENQLKTPLEFQKTIQTQYNFYTMYDYIKENDIRNLIYEKTVVDQFRWHLGYAHNNVMSCDYINYVHFRNNGDGLLEKVDKMFDRTDVVLPQYILLNSKTMNNNSFEIVPKTNKFDLNYLEIKPVNNNIINIDTTYNIYPAKTK